MRPVLALLLVACGGKTSDSATTPDPGTVAGTPAGTPSGTTGGTATGTTSVIDQDNDGYPADVDCDDTNPAINPGATEICNTLDDNCDTLIDDADPALDTTTGTEWFADTDGDGFGDPNATTWACELPANHVADSTDCNDAEVTWNPLADELCAAGDEDCDGIEGDDDTPVDPLPWYDDVDGDGFGDLATEQLACIAPYATIADGTDCDDADPAVNPLATEICDAIDNDCDPFTSEDGTATWFDAATTDVTADLTGAVGSPAIWATPGPGVLNLCRGTWYANIQAVYTDILIAGQAPRDEVIVDAQGGTAIALSPVLTAGGSDEVRGLTLTGGTSPGGAVTAYNSWTIADCVVRDNLATAVVGGDNVHVQDSEFRDNVSTVGAGALEANNANIDNSWFEGNQGVEGGAVRIVPLTLASYVEVIDTTFVGNVALSVGGAMYVGTDQILDPVEVYLFTTTFSGNTSADFGSALYVYNDADDVTVNMFDSYVVGNSGLSAFYLDADGPSRLWCWGQIGANYGFHSNSGTAGSVAAWVTGGSPLVVSTECDWGDDGTVQDNADWDLFVNGTGTADYGDDATFTIP